MASQPTDPSDPFEKANFDDIYVAEDPRAYYDKLGSLDYVVPHHGQQVFQQVLDAHPSDAPLVVDLCCSYGVNGALLKHNIELDDLYDHYRGPEVASLTRDELAEADRRFFAIHQRDDAPDVVGIDSSAPAVDYAVDAGLVDAGLSENLEVDEPSSELTDVIHDADLITVTGGIGYITDRTFARLLNPVAPDRIPWVAALCLRTVPFEPIAEQLERCGLVTEQLEDVTFPQRRFASAAERAYALRQVADLGLDPDGREADGAYHVNVFVARPVDQAAALPVAKVLDGLTTGGP